MLNQTVHTVKKEGIFFYLLLLTSFFVLLEISFFIQCNKTYLADFSFVSTQLKIPAAVIPAIIYFLSAQVFLHLSYCVVVWWIAKKIASLLRFNFNEKLFLGMSLWLLGIFTVIIANLVIYPYSKFSALFSSFLAYPRFLHFTLWVLCSFCVAALMLALLSLIQKMSLKRNALISVCILSVGSAWYFISYHVYLFQDGATPARPNIIFIGVDSLRPDFLRYFGAEANTPFFDQFLNESLVFAEAVTPLARTYPSWTSILTGEYPKTNQIRYNLPPNQPQVFQKALPAILKKQGYDTLFATDETRFSNLDNAGFDKIVTPPIGLNDFLIGTFNDFPLSNLFINTSLGHLLFPYSYANRPVFFSYDPNSFLNAIQASLNRNRNKPLFLTAHFCLTHYPYVWSETPASLTNAVARYESSVVRVDRQLDDFLNLLKSYGLLNHAIVVLLSDHGEALELSGDRITEKDLFLTNAKNKTAPLFYPPSLDKEEINQSAGHGTDVLGLTQYHTLLAFRTYGMDKPQRRGVIPGIVSILSIKPTVLDLIHLEKLNPQSLANLIRGKQKHPQQPEHLFLESDYSPEAIRTVYPEARKVVLEGVHLFEIDPVTTRLTVKEGMGEMIIHSKQFADIKGQWMLALYPQQDHSRMPILVNLATGKWTNDLSTHFAKHSPAQKMMQALRDFYGNELDSP